MIIHMFVENAGFLSHFCYLSLYRWLRLLES